MSRSKGQRHGPCATRRRRKRLIIRKRDGDNCWVCGEVMLFREDDPDLEKCHPLGASLDHVIERARGGGNDNKNLRLAHRKCNNHRTNGVPKKTPADRTPGRGSASTRPGWGGALPNSQMLQ